MTSAKVLEEIRPKDIDDAVLAGLTGRERMLVGKEEFERRKRGNKDGRQEGRTEETRKRN